MPRRPIRRRIRRRSRVSVLARRRTHPRRSAMEARATCRHRIRPRHRRRPCLSRRGQARLLAAFFQDASRAAADDRSVFQLLAERVAEAVGDGCLVSLTSGDGEWLELAGLHASDPVKVAQTRAATARRRLDGTIYANVIRTGKSLFLASLNRDDLDRVADHFSRDQLALIRQVGANAVMVIPLMLGGRVAGVLVASRTDSTIPYTHLDLEVLEALAARATLVLDNAKTHRELRDASARLETIISESPIATIVLDAARRVQIWNRTAEELL